MDSHLYSPARFPFLVLGLPYFTAPPLRRRLLPSALPLHFALLACNPLSPVSVRLARKDAGFRRVLPPA
uniref:Monosaccharide-sensing protein 2-like n=1 Tax=Rhizophora mucronata TaxID=61149 RepID=A0A2P2IQZ9_RHIMU